MAEAKELTRKAQSVFAFCCCCNFVGETVGFLADFILLQTLLLRVFLLQTWLLRVFLAADFFGSGVS